MVTRQDHHIFRFIAANDVEVLVDRIRGAFVPMFGAEALLGRQQIDELVHLFVQERPAPLNMLHQRMGMILSDHPHTSDP
ncbi:hypothetical protein D3C76_1366460 [compost metagenome]